MTNIASGEKYNSILQTKQLMEILDQTAKQKVISKKTHENISAQVIIQDNTAPSWPVENFLIAESLLHSGRNNEAKIYYRKLAMWGTENKRNGGWGGGSIAVVALWRWVHELKKQAVITSELDEAIEAVDILTKSRFANGLFFDPILPSMPQLHEDIYKILAQILYETEIDRLREKSPDVFLEYLKLSTNDQDEDQLSGLTELALDGQLVSQEKLILLRSKRLTRIGKLKRAQVELAKLLHEDVDLDIWTEAKFRTLKIQRSLDRSCSTLGKIVQQLGDVIDDANSSKLAQDALSFRAGLRIRAGCLEDNKGFISDLENLIERYPDGSRTADALFQLAKYFERTDQLEKSLNYYKRLRSVTGQNNFQNLSRARPAWMLYNRNLNDDRIESKRLFQEIVTLYPSGPLFLRANFWLGRIAEEEGKSSEAIKHFENVIDTSPYDYYAIRARMHLTMGASAKGQLWLDPKNHALINLDFKMNMPNTWMTENSVYSARLGFAIKSGLYAKSLKKYEEMILRFGKRLQDFSIEELKNSKSSFSYIAVLMSTRQDAFAAKDLSNTSDDRVTIANNVGRFAKDWAMSLRLIIGSTDPYPDRWSNQKSILYLRTAYPNVFHNLMIESGEHWGANPVQLYSVARQESLFFNASLSRNKAMGLFQFIPRTFRRLNKSFKMIENLSDDSEAFRYLLKPKNSIDLGARWFSKSLSKKYDSQEQIYVFNLMEHNAGLSAVREWQKQWVKIGRENDIEYIVDTVPYSQTRVFVRRVLETSMIIDAAELFGSDLNER